MILERESHLFQNVLFVQDTRNSLLMSHIVQVRNIAGERKSRRETFFKLPAVLKILTVVQQLQAEEGQSDHSLWNTPLHSPESNKVSTEFNL